MSDDCLLLKEILLRIRQAGFAVPDDVSPYDLALRMMDHIGSTDPELRDDLVYSVLCTWITRGVFTGEQLLKLLDMNLDEDHLFFRIGETENDSVFKRSFCALNVAVIAYRHREQPFLLDEQVRRTKEKMVEYYRREKDVRGYVEVKGWAHSAAHGADALDELAQCSALGRKDLLDILNSIREKVRIDYYTYINQEDERMTTAAVSAVSRNLLAESEIAEWIKGFRVTGGEKVYPQYHALVTNIKGFLRSLYFRLLDEAGGKTLTETIRETLAQIR